jgi:hypothetical protein
MEHGFLYGIFLPERNEAILYLILAGIVSLIGGLCTIITSSIPKISCRFVCDIGKRVYLWSEFKNELPIKTYLLKPRQFSDTIDWNMCCYFALFFSKELKITFILYLVAIGAILSLIAGLYIVKLEREDRNSKTTVRLVIRGISSIGGSIILIYLSCYYLMYPERYVPYN